MNDVKKFWNPRCVFLSAMFLAAETSLKSLLGISLQKSVYKHIVISKLNFAMPRFNYIIGILRPVEFNRCVRQWMNLIFDIGYDNNE